jgi:hypothetical protein
MLPQTQRTLSEFIKDTCAEQNIDESHGYKHSVGTMVRAQAIMDTVRTITREERKMILYCAALHDLCDSKYTDVAIASLKIKVWLIWEDDWATKDAEALIRIITTMSYSKLKKIKEQNGVHTYPNHGKWQRAYHIARQADILESFIPARCVLYNMHVHPDKTDDEHWAKAEQLFNERVFQYVKGGWITIPGALAMVPGLEEEARRCLKERSMRWD